MRNQNGLGRKFVSMGRLYILCAIFVTHECGCARPAALTEVDLPPVVSPLMPTYQEGIDLDNWRSLGALQHFKHHPMIGQQYQSHRQFVWSAPPPRYDYYRRAIADVIGKIGVRSLPGRALTKKPTRRVRLSRAGRTGRAVQGPFFSEKTRLRFLNALRQFEETKDSPNPLSPSLREGATWRMNALGQPAGGDKGAALSIGLELRALTEMLQTHRKQQNALHGVHQKLIDIG